MCSCVPCLISFGFAFASVSRISDAVCALLFQVVVVVVALIRPSHKEKGL